MSGVRKLLLAALILGLAVALLIFDGRTLLRDTLDGLAGLGAWAPVLFVLVYVVATVLWVPGSALTLGAGALFGVGLGSALVSLGATLGATAAFLVGRYFARDWVARKIVGNRAFAAIDRAVATGGWRVVGLTRLSPAFPFTLLNYAFGVTRVSLRDYVLASWIGMMPGTVMYVYLGSLVRAVGERQRTPAEWVLYGVGLVATVGVTAYVTRLARASLRANLKPADEAPPMPPAHADAPRAIPRP